MLKHEYKTHMNMSLNMNIKHATHITKKNYLNLRWSNYSRIDNSNEGHHQHWGSA